MTTHAQHLGNMLNTENTTKYTHMLQIHTAQTLSESKFGLVSVILRGELQRKVNGLARYVESKARFFSVMTVALFTITMVT